VTDSLATTLLELLRNIFGDEEERAAFLRDSEGYMEEHGFEDLDCEDFDEAFRAFVETDVKSGGYDLGADFDTSPTRAHDGQSDTEAITEKLTKVIHEHPTYVTNNYEDNDVVNDTSFKGTLIAEEDVVFDNDITSATNGGVAAGDDIDGPTNTGDIEAEDSTINFGSGTAVGGGNDYSQDNRDYDNVGNDYRDYDNVGNETDSRSYNNVGNDTDNSTDISDSGNTDNSQEYEVSDSGNTDNSQQYDISDSGNTDNSSDDDISDSGNIENSGNTEEDGPGDQTNF
jgi:hypothetical protein